MRDKLIKLANWMLMTKSMKKVYMLLRKLGVTKAINILFDIKESIFPTSEMIRTREVYKKNREIISEIYNSLEDEESKHIYKNLLLYRTTKKRKYLKDLTSKTVYFEKDIISVNDKEVFIDCGAFDGDSIQMFLDNCNKKYKRIVAFEPDKSNYKLLKNNIEKMNLKNIDIFNIGTWNREDTLHFESDSVASNISNEGTIEIKVNSIDNILQQTEATFIKMDVEGAEMNTLKGAHYTINTYRPILAVCIYHSPEEMFTLPYYIKNLDLDYKLYIRHYSDNYSETVCYAIP